jgi:hypothetical protein
MDTATLLWLVWDTELDECCAAGLVLADALEEGGHTDLPSCPRPACAGADDGAGCRPRVALRLGTRLRR